MAGSRQQTIAEQLSLPFTHDRTSLKDYFEKVTGKTLSLTLTDNSSSMLSVSQKGALSSVRLHRMFLDAGKDVIIEIARFIKTGKGKTPCLRRFVRRNGSCLNKRPPKAVRITTDGRYHNLGEIFKAVNHEYFENRVSCLITWGQKVPRHAVKKRTLGSYSRHGNTIRISPVLDRREVPRFFIEFVVYHEMLHAGTGSSEKNGRRVVHSKDFRQRERQYRHYEKAVAWEKGKRL